MITEVTKFMETGIFAVLKSQLLLAPFAVFALWFAAKKLSVKFQWRLHKGIIIALLVTPILFLLPMEQRIQRTAKELVLENNIPIPFFYQNNPFQPAFEVTDYKTDDTTGTQQDSEPVLSGESEKKDTAKTGILEGISIEPGFILFLLTGAGLLRFLLLYLVQRRRLKGVTRGAVQKRTIGGIEIIYSTKINSPFSAGLIKKQIFLPAMYLGNQKFLTPVLQHEIIHIQKGHIYWTFIEKLLTCLFWYNPYIHFLHDNGEKLREFICDKKVAAKVTPIRYGKALLDSMENKGPLGQPAAPGRTYHLSTGWRKNNIMKQRFTTLFDNKKKKSKFTAVLMTTALITACLVLLGLAACSTEPLQNTNILSDGAKGITDENVTITINHWRIMPYIENAIELYQQKHPNVTIKYQEINSTNRGLSVDFMADYKAGLQADLQADTMPDIIWARDLNLYKWAEKGHLADLGAYMENDPVFNDDNYYMNIFEAFSVHDGIYAVPLTVQLMPLWFYGVPEQLAEYGISIEDNEIGWDTLLEINEKLAQAGDSNITFSAIGKNNFMYLMFTKNLLDYIDFENYEASYTDDDFVNYLKGLKAIETSTDFILYPDAEEYNYNYKFDTALTSTPNHLFNYWNILIDKARFGDDIDKVEIFSWKELENNYFDYFDVFSVYSGSPNKEVAWDFLKFLLSPEIQAQLDFGYAVNKEGGRLFRESDLQDPLEEYQDALAGWDPPVYIDRYFNDEEVAIYDDLMKKADTRFQQFLMVDIFGLETFNHVTAYMEGTKTAEEVAQAFQDAAEDFFNNQ